MDEKSFLLSEKYEGTRSPEYEADSARLDAGEPLAYVIGWAPFLGCRIFLDSHPLIPRPETEYWGEKALQEIKAVKAPRVLDIFAGSGALGIAALKEVPDAAVDFAEIDPAHFPVIRKNISENGMNGERTNIIETDVWSNVPGMYDFVLANPPYVSKNRIDRVQESVLRHEPEKALFAEEEGFALIRRLIEGAPAHLAASGFVYIEHEPEQTEMLQKVARGGGFSVETYPDQYGVARYSVLRHAP